MSSDFNPIPVTLTHDDAQLEPIAKIHAAEIYAAGCEEEIWRYLPRPPFDSLGDAKQWIEEARSNMNSGQQVVFAIKERSSGKVVGSTRYMDIRRNDRSLEIGWTWITPGHQRTAINTQCKLLLLEHAFETLGAIKVTLKTDSRNIRSQKAIERIGASREGVLRNHMILWNGAIRDSVYYGIIPEEWPKIKATLSEMLRSYE